MKTFMYKTAALALCGVLAAGAPLMASAANPPLTATFSSSAPSTTAQNPIPVTITFSEGVTNFTAGDLNIGNGSVTNFASSTSSVYTFGILPAASGSVSVDLNGGVVTGADGQTNQAAPQLQFIYNPSAGDAATTTNTGGSASSTPPSLVITGGPADGSTISSTTATFTFTTDGSVVVCDFGGSFACGSPLTLGSASAPLGDSNYTLTITASNGGTASTSVTTHFTVAAATTTATTSAPVLGCTNSSATNFNSAATSDDGSCVFPPASSAPAPSGGGGGGGGGGGVISGPLSVGYINTNPYGNAPAATISAPVPVALELPGPKTTVGSGKVLGVSTSKPSAPKVAVATPKPKTSVSPASNALAINIGTSSATLNTASSATPAAPNTGANTAPTPGTPAWLWVGIALVVIVLGGAWALLRGAP